MYRWVMDYPGQNRIWPLKMVTVMVVSTIPTSYIYVDNELTYYAEVQ